ncbi:hypothetical protein QQX98_011531 [Neonectria punicea]|uniref:NB-ARC domain-containing protein n=1 Tax=Neonectria punicea TaxID=979145 RepID=A0ABR1GLT3_9HYPO
MSSDSAVNVIRLSWKPVDRKFQHLQKKIEDAGRSFKEEVSLHHAKETHELRKEGPPKKANIPCRIIPSAHNRLFFPRLSIKKQIEDHLLPTKSASIADLKAFLLHGLGGSGKTQLAVKFAYSHWNDYDINIWAVAATERSRDLRITLSKQRKRSVSQTVETQEPPG